jgi:iron complex outermembrane receptor protein
VTVVGERGLRASSSDPTAASTVVDGEELHGAGQSSTDVLARVPGVQVARTGAQSDLATASIRGSSGNQVPVYVAGIRVNDDVSGTADLSTIPIWMMDRVEVFRGNAPASSDQLGLAGAVFFWPRLPRTTRLGAGASIGSFGARGGWLAGEVGSERAGALVAIRRDQADNDYPFLNDQGQRFQLDEHEELRQNADYRATDAWAVGRLRLGKDTRVTTVVNAFDREQGVTGLSVIPALDARATVRRFLSGVSVRTPCAATAAKCALEVEGSYLDAGLTLEDPKLELPALQSPLVHDGGIRGTARAAVTAAIAPSVSVGASLSQAFETVHVDRVDNLPRHGRRATTEGAVNATWRPVDPVTVYALGALECDTTSGVTDTFGRTSTQDGSACDVFEPVGRVGAAYRVRGGVLVLANVGRYVRVPTLAELYGSSPLVQGNATLSPEHGVTADAGVRASAHLPDGSVYALDAFGFVRGATNLIRFRSTSQKSAAPYNVGTARFLGVEALVSAQWWHHVRVESSLTAFDPEDTTHDASVASTVNRILPLTPRFVASSRVEVFAAPGVGALKQSRASLALLHLYRASRYQDPAGQIVLPAENTFDLEATSAHFDDSVVARFAVRNLFDSRQLDFIGLPIPGRSLHAEVEAWW